MESAWSPQQEAAIKAVRAWLKQKDGPQVFRLFGFAGTGKTTLAKELASSVKGSVHYGAFTGKAALMLQKKGCSGASTIHSMIYKIDESETWEPTFKLNPDAPIRAAGLVVIDEVSMVDEALAVDLLSFGRKVLVLGDPAQLPPVKGTGYFTDRDPDIMLTEVHRQARDNPIIAMSMTIREGGNRARLAEGSYGSSRVLPRADIDSGDILGADQVLVGMNRTRQSYNARIRQLKDMDPAGPQAGDKVVCLRNNREKKLLNGGLWTIERVLDASEPVIRMLVSSEDHVERKPTEVRVWKHFFQGREAELAWDTLRGTDQFTYGYALTCHKAQGSQWDNVIVFDEAAFCKEDAWRWRYTALTRAAERVTFVQG